MTGLVTNRKEIGAGLDQIRYAGVNPANGEQLWYDKNGNVTNEFRESDKVTDFMAFDLKFVPQERDKMAILQLPELLAKEKGPTEKALARRRRMTVPDREKPKQADGRKRRSATCTKRNKHAEDERGSYRRREMTEE